MLDRADVTLIVDTALQLQLYPAHRDEILQWLPVVVRAGLEQASAPAIQLRKDVYALFEMGPLRDSGLPALLAWLDGVLSVAGHLERARPLSSARVRLLEAVRPGAFPPARLARLTRDLDSTDPVRLLRAIAALRGAVDHDVLCRLGELAESAQADVAREAMSALCEARHPGAMAHLFRGLNHLDWEARAWAAFFIGERVYQFSGGEEGALCRLRGLIFSPHATLRARRESVHALGKIHGAGTWELLADVLRGPFNPSVHAHALGAATRLRAQSSPPEGFSTTCEGLIERWSSRHCAALLADAVFSEDTLYRDALQRRVGGDAP